jgi:ferric-dicitrate binding protein FerR (iron transport regulator)
VGSGGNKVLLNPGMESVCSRESNELEIRHVNTNFAVAWRSGYFMFNDEDLDNILTILSRWYGVKFVYDEPVTDKNTFSGRLSKYNDISTTLNSITMTGGPAFSIDRNRNTVHISSIRQIN